jgi:hypothetical protein
MRPIVAACALTFAACGSLSAGPTNAPTADGPGVKVGEKAPDFKLMDQTGAERSLADFLKNGPVALVFYRSASW